MLKRLFRREPVFNWVNVTRKECVREKYGSVYVAVYMYVHISRGLSFFVYYLIHHIAVIENYCCLFTNHIYNQAFFLKIYRCYDTKQVICINFAIIYHF